MPTATPARSPHAPMSHAVPAGEEHDFTSDCTCRPFVYDIFEEEKHVRVEVRHNSWSAQPVDEEALEAAQGVTR